MRQSYVVTNPSDVEGFKAQVLKSAQSGTSFTITAKRSQSEFMLRREGAAAPLQLELSVATITFLPTLSAILHWVEGDQDLYLEENDGKIQFGIYAD